MSEEKMSASEQQETVDGSNHAEQLPVDEGNDQAAHADAFDHALEQSSQKESDMNASNAEGDELVPPPTDSQRVQEAEREALRAKAELENFRKRMVRESEQQLKYANMSLVRDLLDAIDNLNRATEAARSDSNSPSALLEGVQMVSQQFEAALAKHGCTAIQATGVEFDPNFHEAIAQTPSQEYAAGIVAQEVAVGYRLHDRVVRPSQVIVSTGPS